MHSIENFELSTPAAISLTLQTGSVLRATGGRLWLTLAGHPDDIWLKAGERWTMPSRGTVCLSAEPAAAFQILHPVASQRMYAPIRASIRALFLSHGLSLG